ncbi:MAG TPA: glycosyltransferase [Acidimicrobiales bacterium]
MTITRETGETHLILVDAPFDAPEEDWSTWGAAASGAKQVITPVQVGVLVSLLALFIVGLYRAPDHALRAALDATTFVYLLTGLHKVRLLVRSESASGNIASEPILPEDDQLPIYTVMVPLHREGRVIPSLVQRLEAIDYPPDRLQILLLIETDDEETVNAVAAYPLPVNIRPVLMAPGEIRTKPRALNIGLQHAAGEFVVVYDAEDQPEPDQLRKAVAALRSAPEEVVCVQARLNFYNRHQSTLTRLFAIDYAIWYDQLLPGLSGDRGQRHAFVPLGGTSNHFWTEMLRHIGGWDPYNVTEDCDLAVRLSREGFKVAMMDSVTWEEAVPRVQPWIKQRSRWIKGYLQTFLVHTRHPFRLWREVHSRAYVDFHVLVGGTALLLLLNPLMWTLTAVYMSTKGTQVGGYIQTLYPPYVYYPSLVSLLLWNFILFYTGAYVCVRHGLADLARYALLVPFYWVILSVGAWVGLISLVRNPFYWDKTEHGVSVNGT